MAGFQNSFKDHKRLSEWLLESQAATEKPEQASWGGLLEGFSHLVSKQNLYFCNVLLKKTEIVYGKQFTDIMLTNSSLKETFAVQ